MSVTPTEATLRLVQLDVVVRFRRLGVGAWIALLGWVALAFAQEPLLLRAFGANLGWQAAWSGATVVLLCLLSLGPAPRLRGIRHSVYVGLGLVTLVGLVQALIAGVADWLVGEGLSVMVGATWLWFVIAFLPLACVVPAPSATLPMRAIQSLTAVYSLAVSTTCWRDGLSSATLAAFAVAVLGALLAIAGQRRLPARGRACA